MDYFCKTQDKQFVKRVLKLASSRNIAIADNLFNLLKKCEGIHINHHRIQVFTTYHLEKYYCERISKKELIGLIKQLPARL